MSLADVYGLLRGSTDEHKFAGLALLPRVCTAHKDVQYQDVYEAISLDFIWRLLVPLRDPRFISKIDNREDVQKQLLGVTIALSVLSLLTRDETVAKDPELVQLIPSLAKLVRSTSLSAACGKKLEAGSPYPELADVHQDSLELLWNLCSQADDGLAIARQSGSISSVSAWLRNHFMLQPTPSTQCALSLLYAMLEPFLSQSSSPHDSPSADTSGSSSEMDALKEVHAAVSGISAMCAADCSAKSTMSEHEDSSITEPLENLELTSSAIPTSVEAQAFQLQGFGMLAATIPCLAWLTSLQPERRKLLDPDWAQDLRDAALRALRSRLPLNHLLHVLSALHALSDLQGAHVLLFRQKQPTQCVTSLLATLVQVLKVQVYSHLQGCILHVRTSGVMSVLSEGLRMSEAAFTISLRLLSDAIDLVVMIEETQVGDDSIYGGGTLSTHAAILTAKSEGVLLQVLHALEESAIFMLDFVAFIAAGSMTDGPEPQQIPQGFRAPPPADHAHADSPRACSIKKDVLADQSSAERLPHASAFKVPHFPGETSESAWVWVHRTMKACCHTAGMLISIAGGVDASTKLLGVLPDLCTWICSNTATGEQMDSARTTPQPVALVESLLSALYSMHTLQVSGGAVADGCQGALTIPNVFMLLGVSCVNAINRPKRHDSCEVWRETLASDTVVACELFASAVRRVSDTQLHAAEQLHEQFWQDRASDSSQALLPGIMLAGNNLLCSLAVRLPAYVASAVDSDEDATAVMDAVGAIAALTTAVIARVAVPEAIAAEVIEALRNACGAVRLMLECVLSGTLGGFAPLVQSLVSAGEEESTCWQFAEDHLILACLHQGLNTGDISSRCCDVCLSICAAVEGDLLLAAQVCEGTWVGTYSQNDDAFDKLCSVLWQEKSSACLGHAIRKLAVAVKA